MKRIRKGEGSWAAIHVNDGERSSVLAMNWSEEHIVVFSRY